MRMQQCTALSDGIVEWSTASARRTFRPHCTTSPGNGTPFGWYLHHYGVAVALTP